jgi:hypothetical protein
MIKEAISNLPDFDNIVQKSCENEYMKSKLHIRDFLFSLAIVKIADCRIELDYFGDCVNSSFRVAFIKEHGKWLPNSPNFFV